VLIGDFGGGTSDFSLVRLGEGGAREVLATAGLPYAGDAFDARIVRRVVAPALGSDSLARSMGKTLPALPAWVYSNLERWHTLSFLRTRSTLEMLATAEKRALEPEKIAALRALVEEDLGYQLHRAVSRLKTALSGNDRAAFRFGGSEAGSLELHAEVTREEFEGWIAPELRGIEDAIDGLVVQAGVGVDRVFLTGGTSFVPAVRRIFEQRFPGQVTAGDEFTSVAQGLALAAAGDA
ncbi:MAG: Hsp70 family protein, partial [Janthinobacterium lividum]